MGYVYLKIDHGCFKDHVPSNPAVYTCTYAYTYIFVYICEPWALKKGLYLNFAGISKYPRNRKGYSKKCSAEACRQQLRLSLAALRQACGKHGSVLIVGSFS